MRYPALALSVGLVIAVANPSASQAPGTTTARPTPADTTHSAPMPGGVSTPNADPFPSTYRPFASRPTLIRNVTILTAAGPTIRNGSVLLRDGKIA
ncbi:MAG: hypothetical protein ABI969_17290, partial [bacterium]